MQYCGHSRSSSRRQPIRLNLTYITIESRRAVCSLVGSNCLARAASRCRRACILPLWFLRSFFFLSLFLFSTPNLWGHWTDLNQNWTCIHLWLLFEKLGPNSPRHLPPRARGQKRFWGPTLNFDRTYLCNGTLYQQSEKNLSIYRDSPTCPQIWWAFVQKRLRTVGEFLLTPYFRTGRHCQPYRMDVI